ncbi:conserved protein of unknown function [Rhodovastum atsumiense]|nr:conserved protein of unknown function [Rhodovastum atsumiense]
MCAMSGFACQNLRPDEVHTVYPLVREVVPTLDLKTWTRIARRIANPKRADQAGIRAVLRQPRQLPCGLFLYRREHDLAHGPILIAEHMVAMDVLDPEAVMSTLVAELEALAERLGCAAIRTMVLGKTSLAASGLYAAGHRPEGATLWKSLDHGGEGRPNQADAVR